MALVSLLLKSMPASQVSVLTLYCDPMDSRYWRSLLSALLANSMPFSFSAIVVDQAVQYNRLGAIEADNLDIDSGKFPCGMYI